MRIFKFPITNQMIVIGSNTSDNGQSHFTEDVLHFLELRQNRQLALLKRSAKNQRRRHQKSKTGVPVALKRTCVCQKRTEPKKNNSIEYKTHRYICSKTPKVLACLKRKQSIYYKSYNVLCVITDQHLLRAKIKLYFIKCF